MQESTGSSKSKPVEATEAKTSAKVVRSGKRLRGDPQPEDVVQISDEEQEETAIDELASKKMRLEVEVKKAELKSLRSQKQAAVEKVKEISSELEAVHKLIGEEKECLKQHKEEENLPIPETNEGDTSMPVLEEETSREDSMDTREKSGSTVEMAEVDMSLERDTESPPEARHRLPLVVAPRESIPSLRRPMPPRPLHSQSPTLPTTSV